MSETQDATAGSKTFPQSPFMTVPITKLQPGRYQVRKEFDQEKLKNLAKSLKMEGDFGVIVVRRIAPPNPDPTVPEFDIVAGERRWRAHQLNGTQEVTIRLVEPVSEAEVAMKGLLENTQREDLDPIEEAEGFAQANKLDSVYWTHEEIASAVGRDKSYVTNSIRLLQLPEKVQMEVRRRTLNRSIAIELLSLPTPEGQIEGCQQILDKKLTVQKARQLIAKMLNKDALEPKGKGRAATPSIFTRKARGVWIDAVLPDDMDPALFFQSLQAAYTQWVSDNPPRKSTAQDASRASSDSSPNQSETPVNT